MKRNYYIYGLCEETGLALDNCFYIGKGKNDRLNDHFYDCYLDENTSYVQNLHKVRKILKLQSNNIEVYSSKIEKNLSENEAYELERFLIKEIGLENLTNIHPGGEGGREKKLSEEHKKKLSEAMKGVRRTKSHRENLSKSLMGINRPVGEEANFSKLNKKEVEQIKYDLHELNKNQDKIAKEFYIYQATVSQISREETWSHVNARDYR